MFRSPTDPPLRPLRIISVTGEPVDVYKPTVCLESVPASNTAASTPNPISRPSICAQERLENALFEARQAVGLGDSELAITYVEYALRIAQENPSDAVDTALQQHKNLIESILIGRLGSYQARLMRQSFHPAKLKTQNAPF